MGVQQATTLATTVGTQITQNQGATANANLQAGGLTNTLATYYSTQAGLARQAAKTEDKIGYGVTVGAAVEGAYAVAHMNSVSKVKKEHNAVIAEEDALQDKYGALPVNDPNKAALLAELQQRTKNANINAAAETKAQQGMMLQQLATTAATGGQAAMMFMNSNALKAKAAALDSDAAMVAGTPPPFVYNGPGAATNGATNPMTTPTPDQAAVTQAPTTPGGAGGDTPINPNLGDNNPNSPMAGSFNPTNPSASNGGGGATGGGGAGGTSAAKDDAKTDPNAMAGKSQTGGVFGSADGGGFRSRASAGGNGAVGVDSSFSDLLKKMLDGGDKATADAGKGVDQNDRMPASDSAAVLGRNQNIFDEIHKRYVKKLGEGAIVFGEGQS